jgi:hypothetical protein
MSFAYTYLGLRNIFILESAEDMQMQPIIQMVLWQTTAVAPGTCGCARRSIDLAASPVGKPTARWQKLEGNERQEERIASVARNGYNPTRIAPTFAKIKETSICHALAPNPAKQIAPNASARANFDAHGIQATSSTTSTVQKASKKTRRFQFCHPT